MKILRNRKFERFVVVAALAATAAIAFATGTQGRAEHDASTAARIQHLEDIEEIRALLVEYGRLLDAHDLAGYSRLFARDGEWIGGFGSAKGPAAIQALMEKNLGATPTSSPGSTYHLLTNFEIEVHGDKATAWSRWSFTVTADNRPSILYGGHYDDILVREDGHWKFLRRVAATDIPRSDPTEKR
ncbi:MAG TPA: nuclear transport factor 2 family protein [Candidatus Acidoferrales bacterium]|nr:nuclear transport factor 2 family protein [Candidatus Acidoferrales bacterium]